MQGYHNDPLATVARVSSRSCGHPLLVLARHLITATLALGGEWTSEELCASAVLQGIGLALAAPEYAVGLHREAATAEEEAADFAGLRAFAAHHPLEEEAQ